MKILKKGLAAMLAACMLLTMLPAALAAESADPETPAQFAQITYNLGDGMVKMVTDNPEMAGQENCYQFEADGSYTIPVEENAFFPYEVQMGDYSAEEPQPENVWFETPDSEITFAGHTFRVAAKNAIVLTDVRPAEKDFSGAMAAYMLPLTQKDCVLNVLTSIPAQLRAYKVSDILANADIPSEGTKIPAKTDSQVVLWAVNNGYSDWEDRGNASYKTLADGDTIDLTRYSEVYFIIGSGNQLAGDNTLYRVNIDSDIDDLIEGEIYVQNNGKRESAARQASDYFTGEEAGTLQLNTVEDKMPKDTTGYLGLALKSGSGFSGFNVEVYTGLYKTKEELDAAIAANATQNITDKIWNQTMSNQNAGYSAIYEPSSSNYEDLQKFTLKISDGSTFLGVEPFIVDVNPSAISMSGRLYLEENSGPLYLYSYSHRADSSDGIITNWFTIDVDETEHKVDDKYWLQLSYSDPSPIAERTSVVHAVKGNYDSKEAVEAAIASGATDYWANGRFTRCEVQLNSEAGEVFTIVNSENAILKRRFRITKEEKPYQGSASMQDVYFRVFGAKDSKDGYHYATNTDDTDSDMPAEATPQPDMYLLPYQHDSYYGLGFQTVFVNAKDEDFDLEHVKPIFYAFGQRKVYAGTNIDDPEGKTEVVKSGESNTDFRNNRAVPYSVAGEDGYHLKNYWVTFVTKQTGSKLFVNGANDPDPAYKNADGSIKHDVFLDEYNNNEHDIFIANVGDQPLENITVTLENAQNIKLDDYWNIKEGSTTRTLPAFDQVVTDKDAVNPSVDTGVQLPNVAKIRLLKDEEAKDTDIKGKLTISADGQTPVVLELTGTIGSPRILTETLDPPNAPTAVQYVHYSALIQHNNRYRWNDITFSLVDGKLPEGLELQKNGEIYGVPTAEPGQYTFTVEMTSRFPEGNNRPQQKTYTIEVLENTDANVDAASMDENFGYEVLDRIPDRDTYNSSELFRSEGVYGEYIEKREVRIDGEKLEEGVDYDSEEGSTKITVRAQTLSKLSKGTHTLSVEFRSGKTMKRSAQNFKKGSGSSSSSSSNKGSSGGGGGSKRKPSSNTNKTPTTPSKPSTPSTPSQPKQSFNDVPRTDWSFNDVEWANTNGLMVGIGNEQFGPTSQISDAMVVSVLARLAKADLSAYTSASFEDIADGQWYSSSASWARAIGIIGSEPFQAAPPCPRGDLAVMLVRYFDNLKIPYSVAEEDVYLADAEQMNADELKAFQILVKLGIIKGKGNNTMDPAGATTRAELAALLHRVSDFVTASGR